MRAGTPFENPFATGGERAGQDFARGNGAGSGGGGGLVIAAIPIFLIVVSVGLPAIFLAFFATPFLLFMQRTDGQLPPFAPAFIAMAKELFVLLLVLIALNILIGFVPDALRGNALLRALHWVIMDLVTWWSGVDPRNGIAFRGLVMEPPGLHLRAASVMLLLAPPFPTAPPRSRWPAPCSQRPPKPRTRLKRPHPSSSKPCWSRPPAAARRWTASPAPSG